MATIPIKNPKLGDTQLTLLGMVVRHTAGNDLKVYKDTGWPTLTRYHLEFEAVSKADMDTFVEFLIANRGQLLEYTDPLGATHSGLVTTEKLSVTEAGECNFQTSFDFEIVP